MTNISNSNSTIQKDLFSIKTTMFIFAKTYTDACKTRKKSNTSQVSIQVKLIKRLSVKIKLKKKKEIEPNKIMNRPRLRFNFIPII